MSLGVDDRSPSAAEASEMTEGCREWQGLTLTAGKQGQWRSEGWRERPHLHRRAGDSTNAPIIQTRTLRRRGHACPALRPSIPQPHSWSESSFQKNLPSWPWDPIRPPLHR